MANKPRLRSQLGNLTEFNLLMSKLKSLLAASPRHITFQKGTAYRVSAADCASVVVDPAGTPVIQFTRSGQTAENYAEGDVQIIKRLRTKKYLIKIKATAVSS